MKKKIKLNYYIGIGMLLSSTFYVLREVQLIPDWVRLIGLVSAIVLMVYGVFHSQKNIQN